MRQLGTVYSLIQAMLGVQSNETELRLYRGRIDNSDAAQDAVGVIKKALLPQRFVSLVLNECKEELKAD
jgi:hypothetical protein